MPGGGHLHLEFQRKENNDMDFSFARIFSLAVTFLGFGFLGYRLSKKFSRPVVPLTWIEVAGATILATYVMPNAILIGFFEVQIFVNNALQAVCAGILTGLAAREIRR